MIDALIALLLDWYKATDGNTIADTHDRERDAA